MFCQFDILISCVVCVCQRMAAQMKALEQDYEAVKEKFEAAKARYLVLHINDFVLVVIVVQRYY